MRINNKPVVVADIATASIMILPPITPKKSDINTYANDTAYSRDDIVTNNGVLYWAYVAGTSGSGDGPTHESGDATDGTVTWRRIPRERNTLSITNSQAVEIALAPGNAAEQGKGTLLTTNGSVYKEGFEDDVPWQGAWYAIAASGSGNELAIQEG